MESPPVAPSSSRRRVNVFHEDRVHAPPVVAGGPLMPHQLNDGFARVSRVVKDPMGSSSGWPPVIDETGRGRYLHHHNARRQPPIVETSQWQSNQLGG